MMAKEMGWRPITDPFATRQYTQISDDLIDRCREYVKEKLTADFLATTIADEYLGKMQQGLAKLVKPNEIIPQIITVNEKQVENPRLAEVKNGIDAINKALKIDGAEAFNANFVLVADGKGNYHVAPSSELIRTYANCIVKVGFLSC
jgi:hypothetical protein